VSFANEWHLSETENPTKYIVIGEKGKAQLQRDSKKSIHMVITETQKLPISYTQVGICLLMTICIFDMNAVC
jgi:hypothetical protein